MNIRNIGTSLMRQSHIRISFNAFSNLIILIAAWQLTKKPIVNLDAAIITIMSHSIAAQEDLMHPIKIIVTTTTKTKLLLRIRNLKRKRNIFVANLSPVLLKRLVFCRDKLKFKMITSKRSEKLKMRIFRSSRKLPKYTRYHKISRITMSSFRMVKMFKMSKMLFHLTFLKMKMKNK